MIKNSNIVILPSGETLEKALKLSSVLGKRFESYYTLQDEKVIPHLSLYQIACPKENYEEIPKKLAKIVKDTSPLELKLSSFTIHANTFVFWNAEKTSDLVGLHEKISESLNTLREGTLAPDIRPDGTGYRTGQNFTEEQMKSVKKYGYPVAGSLFDPHITIGKFKSLDDKEFFNNLFAESTFTASEVCVGKLGDHGEVVEILKKISLGK